MLNSTQLAEAARSNEQSRQLQAMGEALLGANNNGLAVVPGVGGVLRGQQYMFTLGGAFTLQAPGGYRLIIDWLSPGNRDPALVLLDSVPVGNVPPSTVLTDFDCGGAVVSVQDIAGFCLYHYVPISPDDGLLALWPAGSLVDSIFGRRWEVSEDDYFYLVGQYDEMQRNGNGAFTWAGVVAVPDGFNGRVFHFLKSGQYFISLHAPGFNQPLQARFSDGLCDYTHTPDTPTLYCVTQTGNYTVFYADGIEVGELLSLNEPPAPAQPISNANTAADFTRYDSSGATFGAFAMWNRALSPAEIAALGTGESPNFPTV